MVRISKTGSTIQQTAYARRIFGAEGKVKGQIAMDVGYSPHTALSASSKIEGSRGFNNAMAKLAAESNNVALSILHEFKARGVKDFSNKDLVGALNAIGAAWSKFNGEIGRRQGGDTPEKNRLRTVILQQIENQTLIEGNVTDVTPPAEEMDF